MRKHHLRDKLQIAVIGGNGFLGRSIIHRLSSYDNLRIFSIDKRQHGVAIDTSQSRSIIQQITMDVGNEGAISSWLTTYPVDVIVFCAGYEHPTDGLSASALEDTKALMALHRTLAGLPNMDLEANEVRPYFLYVSSWSVYGEQKKKLIDENSKEFPANHSGMNKLYCEDLVKRMCSKYGSSYCILRPTEVYGKHNHKELLNKKFWPGYLAYYTDKVVSRENEIEVFSPKAKIDLVPINYFSKVVVECIRNRVEGILNVSSGVTLTMQDLFDKIIENYPVSHTFTVKRSDRLKLENMNISNSKVNEIVPFDHSKYNLDEFISSYIKVRMFEIGKQMAIEDALQEPVTLDMAAIKAKEEYNKRRQKRLLSYKKIKQVAGPQFFKIKVGRLQERSQDLLGEEYTKDKLIAESSAKGFIEDKVTLDLQKEKEEEKFKIKVKKEKGK